MARAGGRDGGAGARLGPAPTRLLAPLVAATLALLVLHGAGAHRTEPRPLEGTVGVARTASADLEAALVGSGGCGGYSDQLGPLVSEDSLASAEASPVRRICLRNKGQVTGRVTLRVVGLVDLDISCSTGEREVDRSCGGSKPGEFTPLIAQRIGLDPTCAHTTIPEVGHPIREVIEPLVIDDVLRPGEVTCLSMRIEHVTKDTITELRGQSDQLWWGYLFDLTA